MMVNPMQAIMQMMVGGTTPQQAIMQMAQRDPRFQRALPFFQGKSPQQIEQTARNMLKEAGIDPEQAKAQIMQQFGMLSRK